MGILKNFEGDIHDNENVNSVAQIDPLLHPHHFDSSSSSSEDEEVHDNPIAPAPAAVAAIVPAVITTRTPKVKKPVSKMPKPILHVKNIGGKQSQGNRQTRRHENMCFLLNLARDLDEDIAEININDLVETTISAFAQLLLNKNKMKVWHEFVELPERQQERIVKLATDKKNKKDKPKRDTTIANSCSSDDTVESFVLVENRTTTNDNQCERLGHLQEEATTCYRRIDPNIRSTFKSMLKRHHLPFDRISWFEDDVIPFFKENPDSVYLRDLNNSFDRMLLHAVCQYLNLISKSFTRDGERYTQVENRRFEFVPPIILLSEYVKSMQVNPNGLVNDIFSNHANKTVS